MHQHVHTTDYGQRFILGILINGVFVAVEASYGFMAHSLALLADAGHNLSDVLALSLAWGATLLAKRLPSERFTYGLQSSSIMVALINAGLLLAAVSIVSWEAVQRLFTPVAPAAGTVMAVAAFGVVINGATAWLFMSGRKGDLNIRGAYLHMAADAGISLGVVVAGGLIMLTGWNWLDPVVSLLIAVVIFIGTWQLLKDSLSLALHGAPRDIDTASVREYLSSLSGVKEVHDLHVWALGTSGVAMSAHLLIPAGHPGDGFIKQATEMLGERFHIGHSTLQIEIGDESGHCHADCSHAHTA